MSDFDKEAEREKLREKYGEEDEKREATEQMSELLLKGATMTNAHCTDCGDPIFRYDGQEFCPTCQKPVAREESEGGEDNIEVADPSDDATVQFGAEGDGAQEDANGDATPEASADRTDTQTADQSADEPTPSADQPGQPETPTAQAQSGTPTAHDQLETPSTGAPTQRVPSADPERDTPAADQSGAVAGGSADDTARGDDVAANLSAAESLLAKTVHRYAQRAAASDDPRRAREYLSAAREAAETLDAVRF